MTHFASETATMVRIDISRDFSRFPGGRYRKHGKWSGEEFREEKLIPALHQGDDVVEVLMDETSGYPSSFLEEAFGGLVRKGFKVGDLRARLKLIARSKSHEIYPELAWSYIEDQAKRANA